MRIRSRQSFLKCGARHRGLFEGICFGAKWSADLWTIHCSGSRKTIEWRARRCYWNGPLRTCALNRTLGVGLRSSVRLQQSLGNGGCGAYSRADSRCGQLEIAGGPSKAFRHAGRCLRGVCRLSGLKRVRCFLNGHRALASVTGRAGFADTSLPGQAPVLGEAAACFLLPVEFGVGQGRGWVQNSCIPFGAAGVNSGSRCIPGRPFLLCWAWTFAVFAGLCPGFLDA